MEAKRLLELFDRAIDTDTINEVSIDPNANKGGRKSVYGTLQDCKKELDRETGFLILEREIKKIVDDFQTERLMARMSDYSLYLHDSTHIPLVYCASFNLERFWRGENKFGRLTSKPVKRLDSYIAEVGDFLDQSCLHVAGAVGLASIFIDMAYILCRRQYEITVWHLRHDKKVRKYVKNLFQQLRYTGNHNSRGDECPFWNVSAIDIWQMYEFFKFEIDCELLMLLCWELQLIFLEEHNEANTNPKEERSPFPIVTVNSQDPSESKLINWMAENTNFFNYNYFFSKEVKFAMCCFGAEEEVLIKDDFGVTLTTFKSLPDNNCFYVWHKGLWVEANKVALKRRNKQLYQIETVSHKTSLATEDHLWMTLEGEKRTDQLTEQDYLLVDDKILLPSTANALTYEEGLLVGAYLGDGSSYRHKKHDSVRLFLCLNEQKSRQLDYLLNDWSAYKNKTNSIVYSTSNKHLISFILHWASEDKSPERELNMNCLLESVEFRQGILDGIMITDGGNRNRVYTTSPRLADQIEVLMGSLGLVTSRLVDDRVGQVRPVRETETIIPRYPVHCVRFYSFGNRSKYHGVFVRNQTGTFIRINSITKSGYDRDKVYCLEVSSNSPWFTLPNGVITHNCRFVTDGSLVEDYGSYGNSFAASPFAISCHRVVTINLPRIALQSSSKKGFKMRIRDAARDCAVILKAHKNLIQSFADKGVYPLINDGWIQLNRMLSAIGVIGMPEMQWIASKRLGEGVDYVQLALEALAEEVEKLAEEFKLAIVVEQVPGESAAIRLAKADKVIFGEDEQPFTHYSNQFLPLWEPSSFWQRTEYEGKYQDLCPGGGISLLRLASEIKSPIQAITLLKYAYDVGCKHLAPTATYSHCENNCITQGKHIVCPLCGGAIEDYSEKVCGYVQKVSRWEPEKRINCFETRATVTI